MSADEVRDLVAYLGAPAQVPLPGDGPYLDPKTGKVADAIEGETIKVLDKSAGANGAQDMRPFPLAKWSNGAQLWWTGAKPGDKLTVEVPVKEDGRYEVFVVATKAVDYGIVKLTFDEAQSTAPIDLFNDGVVTTPPISLGVHELKQGNHQLTAEITGANDKAVKAYMFAIDYVALIPAKEKEDK
jgi:hypothetical protein